MTKCIFCGNSCHLDLLPGKIILKCSRCGHIDLYTRLCDDHYQDRENDFDRIFSLEHRKYIRGRSQ